MTAPIAHVDCKCGHSKTLHPAANEEACRVPTCGCEEYRPGSTPDLRPPAPTSITSVTPARPVTLPPAPVQGPTAEQLIAAGRRQSGTLKLANKISADLDRLRLRVVEARAIADAKRRREEERTSALAEVERLKTELAAARAKARGDRTPPSQSKPRVVAGGPFVCPDCDREFGTPQAIGPHRAKAHGFRKGA